MKYLKVTLASLCLATLCAPPAMAQGFGFKGKTIDDMELTFDEKVIKRGTPAELVTSFHNVIIDLRSRASIFAKIQKLQIEYEQKWLRPLVTDAGYKQKFAQQLKELEFYKKYSPSIQFEVKKTEKVGAESVVHYTVHSEMTNPCRKCSPDGDIKEGNKECKLCEGKGVQVRKEDSQGRAYVHSVDGKLFIKKLERSCYACKGAKVCTRCQNNANGGNKCYSCDDTKVCRSCEGQGFREDRSFFRGPSRTTDLPKLEKFEEKPDLTNSNSTFSLFSDALTQSRRMRGTFENRCVKGYRKFLKCTVGDKLQKTRERPFRSKTYKLVKKEEIDENTLKFHYSAMSDDEIARKKERAVGPNKGRGEENAEEDELEDARYVLILKKVKDQWKIDSFLQRCWSCDGKGIDYNKVSCKSCEGKKYKPLNRLP